MDQLLPCSNKASYNGPCYNLIFLRNYLKLYPLADTRAHLAIAIMSKKVKALDDWIRTEFRSINTELEEMYFKKKQMSPDGGGKLATFLQQSGNNFIEPLLVEGNTDQGFENSFDVLGNVGLFMASCRRHGITDPSREGSSPLRAASTLAMHIAASLGVVPRFTSSHLQTHNFAKNGTFKTFTALEDERVFVEYNTRGVVNYIRCSDSLRQIVPLGVSHPVTFDCLKGAKNALEEVFRSNVSLAEQLNVDRFFYSVRPYYKPHKVGRLTFRGANAGDFAGINLIDLLLGVCEANDPYYSQLITEKLLFMPPTDQVLLRDCLRHKSLMFNFLELAKSGVLSASVKKNLRMFLDVCDMHGKVATQHHDVFVNRFIQHPAAAMDPDNIEDLTASGPPLAELVKSLAVLRDMRATTPPRDGVSTRYNDILFLKTAAS